MIFSKYDFLTNFTFFVLLFSMFFYWIYALFFFQDSRQFLNSVQVGNAVSHTSAQNQLIEINSKKICLQLGNLGMLLANIGLFFLLAFRWKDSGHFPLSNLYESLLFLSWSCTFIHVFLNSKNLLSQTDNQTFFEKIVFVELIGCLTSPCALFTNAFATFSLPEEMQKISQLVPALQSNWLLMHVTVMIFSYSALIIGSLLSIAFLVVTQGKDVPLKNQLIKSLTNTSISNNSHESLTAIQSVSTGEISYGFSDTVENSLPSKTLQHHKNKNRFQISEILDNLSYRIIGLGFPFLTIGILSGAVWANEAWGSYWSWDPKETWAFLTWLVFAIYLHTRLSTGWEGKKPAIIASFGFFIIWMCYLGVNLIGEGLHSYGWLK